MTVRLHRDDLLAQVERRLSGLDLKLHRESTVETDELEAVYSFPCGVLGIQCCETWDRLSKRWQEAQHELGSIVRQWHLRGGIGPDAYLLFLVDVRSLDSVPLDMREALLHRIRTSRSECMKEVVSYDGAEWPDQLGDLTFVPLAQSAPIAESSKTAVARLLREAGVPAELADGLAGTRPGVHQIAQEIMRGAYGRAPTIQSTVDLDQELVGGEGDARRQKLSRRSGSGVRLQDLTLHNFRSFRVGDGASPVRVDLSSDITLLYGENATGKTSFVQALEWAICGAVVELADQVATEAMPETTDSPLRNLFMQDQAADVTLRAAAGQMFHCVEEEAGRRQFDEEAPLDERALWRQWLGVAPETYEREAELRARCSARLFLGQGQMKQLLSTKDPKARLAHFASLLGDRGLARTTRKLESIVQELSKTEAGLQKEKESLDQQMAGLRDQQRSEAVLVEKAGAGVDAVGEPEEFLRGTTEYHRPAGIHGILDERPTDDQSLAAVVEQVTEHLDMQRRSVQETINRTIHLEELRQQLESVRSEIDKETEKLSAAECRSKNAAERESELREALVVLENSLKSIAERSAQCTQRREAIEWWLRERPLVARRGKRLAEMSDQIGVFEGRSAELSANIGEANEGLFSLRPVVEEAKRRHEEASSRVEKLSKLRSLMEADGQREERYAGAVTEDDRAEHAVYAATEEVLANRQERDCQAIRLENLERALAEVRSGRERRAQILRELQEGADSNECPLCSHKWPSREGLLAAIDRQIGAPTREESDLAQRRDEARENLAEAGQRLEKSEAALRVAETRKRELESQLERLTRRKDERVKALAGCDLPPDTTAADVAREQKEWLKALELVHIEEQRLQAQTFELGEGLHRATEHREAIQSELRELRAQRVPLAEDMEQARERLEAAAWHPSADEAELGQQVEQIQTEEQAHADRAVEVEKKKAKMVEQLEHELAALAPAREAASSARAALQQTRDFATIIESDLRVLQGTAAQADKEEAGSVDDLRRELTHIEDLIREGRAALAFIEVRSARRQLAELNGQMANLERRIEETDAKISENKRWEHAGKECGRLVEREQARLVREGLEPLRDLMRTIHRRLARHPVFDDISWTVDESGLRFWALSRRGATSQSVSDRKLVQAYMNEAQQNLIALSAFLAGALSREGQLRLAILDDPVQAMDELNIYGLLDLLRVLAERMQIIVTTGRSELFHLARAKFSCLNRDDVVRFRAYRLTWGGSDRGTQVEEVR